MRTIESYQYPTGTLVSRALWRGRFQGAFLMFIFWLCMTAVWMIKAQDTTRYIQEQRAIADMIRTVE